MSSYIPYRPRRSASNLGSLEILPQKIRQRILRSALQGSTEIYVPEDLRYTVPRQALALLQASRALRDEVLQSAVTFVFRRPATLNLFLTGESSSLGLSLLSPRHMSSVRLVILDALETVKLTEDEIIGNKGPLITPFFQEWIDASRHLHNHGPVAVVEFDLSHSFPLMFFEVRRLVQRISTMVHMLSGKYTKFRISGCRNPGTQRYIEDSTCALLVDGKRWELPPKGRRRNGEYGPDDGYLDRPRSANIKISKSGERYVDAVRR